MGQQRPAFPDEAARPRLIPRPKFRGKKVPGDLSEADRATARLRITARIRCDTRPPLDRFAVTCAVERAAETPITRVESSVIFVPPRTFRAIE